MQPLAQAEKMDAMGRMAGRIAHDLNNILGAVNGFAGLLLRDLPSGSEPQLHARRILSACDQGRLLAGQLQAFAGAVRSPRQEEATDFGAILMASRIVLRELLPPSTLLKVRIRDAGILVWGRDDELRQVIFNLCINAGDALTVPAGLIEVELARVGAEDLPSIPGGAAPVISAGRLEEGRAYGRLTVTDSGRGVDPETLPHIFEPFFSTKERGVGLGLAVVHGIVLSLRGAYRLSSEPGKGTTVAVYLPEMPKA